jgi:signal transduction histidine kinase/uncharacterized protein
VAVERAAEALDADVAAIAAGGEVVAVVGYPDGTARPDELDAVKPGLEKSILHLPGVGTYTATAASLDHPPGATLVVARPGDGGLTAEEVGLLRGMARVASMTMRMLRVLDDERAARGELERLAADQAALRRVATLVAEAASPEAIFSSVAEEVARLSEADIAKVLRYEDEQNATVLGGWGDPELHLPIGTRLAVRGEGVAVHVLRTGASARTVRVAGPPGSVGDAFRHAGVRVASGSPILVEGQLWGVVIAARTRPEPLPPDAEARIPAFTELVATAIANTTARGELRGIADEQAALRRVATLIARGARPNVVFSAVAEEVGRLVPSADVALVGRYEADASLEFVGGWTRDGDPSFVGDRVSLGGKNVATLVFEGNRTARIARLTPEATPATALARKWARSAAGAPINVEGRLWGVMTVGSRDPDGLPAGIENELADFTELVATAIANAQAREELRRVADEQAALRRVATVVARAAPPAEVFAAVAEELGRLFAVDATGVVRYDDDGTVTSVGSWNSLGQPSEAGTTTTLGGENVSTLVFESRRPARVDRYPSDDPSAATAAAGEQGVRSAVGAPISVEDRLWGALQVASSREAGLAAGTEERLAAFAELVASAIANTEARDELRRVADEQAAVRRVATLVAEAAPPSVVMAAVTEEVGRLLRVDRAYMTRFDGDDTVTVLATWSASGDVPPVELPWRVGAGPLSSVMRRTGRPVRMDTYPGDPAAAALELGIRSAVAAPITVEGRFWGFITVASTSAEPPPPGTEARVGDFTELVATAVANAEAQAELTASRARIVANTDETRRRIERDLHDGAQQRLVTLALQLRAAQASVPPDLGELAAELDGVAAGLNGALDELREFARGIHPAILAAGGLEPALRAVARRSPIPVELDVRTGRLPEPVEVAAYYVVSEALTNAVKHAQATTATVHVEAGEGVLRVSVRDDGAGGAKFAAGSGLAGLRDRVEALGGQTVLESDPGRGTSLSVELPLAAGGAVMR